MLKLYHGVQSVCSIKVRIGLAEMSLDYEDIELNLQRGDQFDPDYMALNPAAVVPTLVDDGLVVVESSLILESLDRVYNDARLMPEGRAAGVAVRHWLLRCIAVHAAINTLSFSTVMRKRQLAAKSMEEIEVSLEKMPDPILRAKRLDLFANSLGSIYVDQALSQMRATLTDMEKALKSDNWVSGESFGLADIALISYIDRLERLGFESLLNATPNVLTWLARMQDRDSYQSEVAARIPRELADGMRADGAEFASQLKARFDALT